MAVLLTKKTDAKKVLKVISVTDSSIDWDASYENPGDLDDDEPAKEKSSEDLPEVDDAPALKGIELKKAKYQTEHDLTKLKFKDGDEPTLFVFHHPHRVDVAQRVRELAGDMRDTKKKTDRDMLTAVFNNFFAGIEEGFKGERQAAPRVNGRLSVDYLQGLEDAEVFIELNAAFMRVATEDRTSKKERSDREGKSAPGSNGTSPISGG